jgi:S1-C subfamily serine protease
LPGPTPAQAAWDALADASASPPSGKDAPAALEDLVTRVAPAVVMIQTTGGRGSGFFISPDTIVTNVHVVGSDPTVAIRRSDGTSATARVQTLSTAFDIAVLKLPAGASDQRVVPLGTSAAIRIGEEVIAIGTPLGFLQNSVSRGIVSGLREVGGATLVQTDAAVNPGNSGGPLLDRDGAVIGIIKSGFVGSNGLSFAVAVDQVRGVLDGHLGPSQDVEATPYEPIAPAVSAPSDQQRTVVARQYEDAIAQVARQADALDAEWKSVVASCYQGRIAGAFDRQWFAVFEPAAMQGVVSPSCAPYFDEVRRAADSIRRAVLSIDEKARSADIYPGTRRDVLRKYRLDYTGWTR